MIKININSIIKHKNFKDVALQLTKYPVFTISGAIILRNPLWVNQASVKTFIIGPAKAHDGPTNIRIEKENLADWYFCQEPLLMCIRNSEWRKIK